MKTIFLKIIKNIGTNFLKSKIINKVIYINKNKTTREIYTLKIYY